MTWFKVDDNLAHHRKVLAAGNAAMGLWVRAGALCAQQLTGGEITHAMLRSIGTHAQARRLVAAGLWRETSEGYAFHEWEERQPSKESVQAERAKTAERQRKWRERQSERNAVTNKTHNGVTNAAPARAVSRPDPSISPLPLSRTDRDTTAEREELTTNQKHAQRALGCPPGDPRLTHIDDLIAEHQPRSPRAWLTRVIDNGDLDNLINDLPATTRHTPVGINYDNPANWRVTSND